MGAFEMQDTAVVEPMFGEQGESAEGHSCVHRPVKDECLIAQKVYDSCRRQSCLTVAEMGVAVAEDDIRDESGTVIIPAGMPIVPPASAVSVVMGHVTVKAITVVDKKVNPFKAGYWNIDTKYEMAYDLIFRDSSGAETVYGAMSVFNAKTSLFGSINSEVTIATDMYDNTTAPTLTTAPFTWVEAKTMGLEAKIMPSQCHTTREVHPVIGLFSIIKLFRLVHLNVQSRGFCIPKECAGQGSINPCKYFGDLDFPMDIFVPPQSREFHTGVSENIRSNPKF